MKKSFVLPVVLALFASLSISVTSYGQGGRSVYLELLGASNGLGINYDARFDRDASSGLGWRTGLGFGYSYSTIGVAYGFSRTCTSDDGVQLDMSHIYNQSFRAVVPVEINYLLGNGPSKLDLGAGSMLCAVLYTSKDGGEPKTSFGAVPYLSAGYRLVSAKGFVFRAGFISPYSSVDKRFFFWPHLGFGKAF